MKKRELIELLRDPSVLRDLEHGLVGDPALWMKEGEAGAQDPKAQKAEIQADLKRRVLARAQAQAPCTPRRAYPRTRARALRYIAAALVLALILVGFFTLVPQGRTLASSLGNLIARKVTGHVIIESVDGQTPPGVLKSSGMKVSGVDGFEMHSYFSVDEYIEKTGRHPVVLTGGYDTIEMITDETDPEAGYTLMIAYAAPGGGYISTSQVWQGVRPEILPDSFEREALGGTMYCEVTEDSMFTCGWVRLSDECVFHIAAPYEMNFDLLLPQLAQSADIDTRAYTVTLPTPDPNQPQQERRVYASIEEFMQDTGRLPVTLEKDFATPFSVEYYPSEYAPNTVCAQYTVEGHTVTVIEQWGNVDGMVASMEDSTYFETTVLGKYTMRASVDVQDGSTAGVAVLDNTVLTVFTEKGLALTDVLPHLVQTQPK